MNKDDLGHKFRIIHECFKANGNARMKKFDLTQIQMNILGYLFVHGDGVTQREIEKHFELKHSTVIGILGRMEKNGFIKLSVSPSDKRQRIITILPKAHDVRSTCDTERSYIEEMFNSSLSKEELSTLRELLDKVCNILKEATKDNVKETR